MSQLSVIKNRIRTISNLNKVTNAMEMVTRTKIHNIRQNSLQAKNYQELYTRLFSAIGQVRQLDEDAVKKPPVKYAVAFFAHKGFCGAFNDQLLSKLRNVLKGEQFKLYLLGRAQSRWKQTEYQHIPANEKTYQAETAPLIKEMSEAILSGQDVEIYFIYNQLISILEQKPQVQKIYPCTLPDNSLTDVLLEPDRDAIYPEALQGFLSAWLDKIYWESAAGEYYARLLSMKNANENADIILNALHIQYNKTRQMRITQELSEVISAFDVLELISEKKTREGA